MWENYFDPPFILKPKHAALFKAMAGWLSSDVGWEPYDDDWDGIGVAVFDRLTQGQKQVAILTVSKALLDPNVEPPKVTAVLAGTVDSIYRHLESQIESEIVFNETELRQMVLEAIDESGYWNEINSSREPDEPPYERLAPDSKDTSEWNELVESLRTDILEDYDFDMEDKFLDMPPAEAARLKRDMNILPDYFTAIVDDPVGERRNELRQEVGRLLYRSK